MKRIIIAIMLLCLVLTGCSSGGTDSDKGQKIVVSMAGSPTDISPLTVSTTEGAELLGLMYETLVRQDADGNIEQGSGLAESWTVSEDGMTYTFTLRDAKWNTGATIIAADFEYAWKEVLKPETASPYAYMLYILEGAYDYNTGVTANGDAVGVKAIDDKTLEVKITQPADYFIGTLVLPQFGPLPVGIVEEMGTDFFLSPDKMIFNGPYMLTEWAFDQTMTYVKNPTYWDAEAVKLEEIKYEFVKETNTVVNMYDSGDLDVMRVQAEFLDTYRDHSGFVTVVEPVTEYVLYNFENEYFANKNIRTAFNLAMDRDSLINDFLKSGSIPAYAFVPAALKGVDGNSFRDNVGDLYYDSGTNENATTEAVEALNAGLAELGKTFEEFNTGLTLIIGEGDENLKMAQVLQERWKDVLGVEIEVRSMRYALRKEGYADTKTFTIGKEGWGADYNDPMTFLDLFTTNNPYNNSNYSNPEYDALIAEAAGLNGNERLALLEDAERMLIEEELVISPTNYLSRSFVSKDNVKGIVRNGIGLRTDYKWAYVD